MDQRHLPIIIALCSDLPSLNNVTDAARLSASQALREKDVKMPL